MALTQQQINRVVNELLTAPLFYADIQEILGLKYDPEKGLVCKNYYLLDIIIELIKRAKC